MLPHSGCCVGTCFKFLPYKVTNTDEDRRRGGEGEKKEGQKGREGRNEIGW